MKYLRLFILIVLAFFLALLDAAFFSFISLSGVTIIFSFLAAIIFALIGRFQDLAAITLALVIFFSVFASLPVWAIFICFFVLPSLLYYLRLVYFSGQSFLVSGLFFTLSTCAFELILLLHAKEWNSSGFTSLGFFTLYNTIAGMIAYYMVKQTIKRFSRGEIRL